jgi:hypothetical protein
VGSRPLLSFAISALAGCSIIYNPDNLPPLMDAPEIDAPIDTPFDSNPDLLDITSVSPTMVLEGQGSGGSRPVVLALNGTAIIGGATVSVELMGSTEPAMLVGFDATADGTKGGVVVRIPVMTDLDAGDPARTLRITITQGNVTKMVDVMVVGLDELTLMTSPVTTTQNPPTYSTITVSNDIHFTGAEPVILKATAGITIDADRLLDANASGGTAGPHGCNGGAMEQPGTCTPSGGGPGVNAQLLGLGAGSGGGGGGFGGPGTIGAGTMAGMPGMTSGNEALVPITSSPGSAGNRGNGGGGGGGTALGNGGPGGGGGGVVWLESGGDITVGSMAMIESRGATTNGGSGGGGGGSGGAIFVRAGGTITSTTRWLAAPGGGASTGSTNPGGAGGAGRIRIDTATGDIASMANNPNAFRGPSWGLATPSLTTTSPATFTFHGQPGRAFDLRFNDQPMGTATPGSSGSVEVSGVALRPGVNRICGVALSGSLQGAEAQSCVELFYAGP